MILTAFHGFTRRDWLASLWHGVIAIGVALLATLALTVAGNARWDAQLVYSLGISLSIWLLIESGFALIGVRQGRPWPGRRRGVAVLIGAAVLGYVIGTNIGDAYSGNSTWELFRLAPGRFFGYIVLSIALAGAVSLYHFTRARDQNRLQQLTLAQRDAARARLSLLQSQLEPHMLFNTLANLRLLIPEDPARAVQMLDHLNGFLRSTLSASRISAHALSDEYARMRDYLELMSVRMGPRLRYLLTLPPALAELPVPPLLLQPLIENSIRHGLEPKVSGGSVQVVARRDARELLIEICDDGIGVAQTRPGLAGAISAGSEAASDASGVSDAPAAIGSPADGGSSFGLQQVAARLHSSYGAAASLSVTPLEGGGTRVLVRLPIDIEGTFA